MAEQIQGYTYNGLFIRIASPCITHCINTVHYSALSHHTGHWTSYPIVQLRRLESNQQLGEFMRLISLPRLVSAIVILEVYCYTADPLSSLAMIQVCYFVKAIDRNLKNSPISPNVVVTNMNDIIMCVNHSLYIQSVSFILSPL